MGEVREILSLFSAFLMVGRCTAGWADDPDQLRADKMLTHPQWLRKNNAHGSKPSWNHPSWFKTLVESALMETLMNRTLMGIN